ncbi:MAG: efflux RND transporter permease subunit [Acidobacteriota bacterium]
MRAILELFARHGVAANLLMVLIVIGGLVSLGQIRTQVFPSFETDLISITVPYPGAAPEEVEQAVCARVEERVQDLELVERVRSVAEEGVGTITLEVISGVNLDRAVNEVAARVDAIDSFPIEAEKPIVQRVEPQHQVLSVAISGPVDELSLRRLGEEVRDDIAALPGVSRVQLAAARPYEISIEVSEKALRRYGLTFDRVAAAVRSSSLDLPGGTVKTESGEILLRTRGQAYRGEDFEQLVLLTASDGTRLTLGEVAAVKDGFADTEQAARFDDHPAVLVQVFRVGSQDIIRVADRVKAYVAQARSKLPERVAMTVWQDETLVLRGRLETLQRNALAGLVLVLAVLALFLDLRVAMWVALGLPVSYLGAAWIMPGLDASINIVSLFSGIIVLGMVVDDAIVVGENIYAQFERGKSGLDAAIDGVSEVATPVLFSMLTTVAAFSPLLMMAGQLGKVIRVIPMIAIAILLFSLIESLLILPRHLSHLRRSAEADRQRSLWQLWRNIQQGLAGVLNWIVFKLYLPLLRSAVAWRYTTVGVAIAGFFLTVGYVAGGHIKFNFFPPVAADNLVALLTMPRGTPSAATEAALAQIESSSDELRKQLAAEGHPDVIRHVLTSIGEQPFRSRQAANTTGLAASFVGGHIGEVNIELAPAEERGVTATQLLNRWRELTGAIPDAAELSFNSSLFTTGEAIDIRLSGRDLDELQTAATELKDALASYPGVLDVNDSFRAGKQQLELELTPQAETLGLTLADLARQVRQAFYGEEAQRIQRDRDEIRVMVRYPVEERRSLSNLEDMRIRTPSGAEVPFTIAGRVSSGRGFATIERTNRRRTVNVTASVDLTRANPNEILADLERKALADLLVRYTDLSYTLDGQQRQQQETQNSLSGSLAIALFLIYALLAIPFRSYLQPLVVMAAIPFGIIGAIWGHVLMGQDLTAFSGFGIVALTGVVINDSLVLVSFINQSYRQASKPLADALLHAGQSRFRPIILTSVTTFVGLTPLLLERSIQAQFLIPMVTSIAFGLLFATLIILVLVPVLFHILQDLKGLVSRGAAATVA